MSNQIDNHACDDFGIQQLACKYRKSKITTKRRQLFNDNATTDRPCSFYYYFTHNIFLLVYFSLLHKALQQCVIGYTIIFLAFSWTQKDKHNNKDKNLEFLGAHIENWYTCFSLNILSKNMWRIFGKNDMSHGQSAEYFSPVDEIIRCYPRIPHKEHLQLHYSSYISTPPQSASLT